MARELQTLNNGFMILHVTIKRGVLAHVEAKSIFFDKIKSRKFEDKKLSNIK